MRDYIEDSERDDEDDLRDGGCLYPGKCCMPGYHYASECHTAEMMADYMAECAAEMQQTLRGRR